MRKAYDVLVLSIFFLLMFLIISWPFVLWFSPGEPVLSTERTKPYYVLPGDTLWDIARKLYPEYDPREVIYEIQRVNGLKDATIYPSQLLELPERSVLNE